MEIYFLKLLLLVDLIGKGLTLNEKKSLLPVPPQYMCRFCRISLVVIVLIAFSVELLLFYVSLFQLKTHFEAFWKYFNFASSCAEGGTHFSS